MNEGQGFHETVLLREVLEQLAPQPGEVMVDATLGHGGHSLEIVKRLGREGLLVGLDRDPQMLETARKRFEAAHVPSSSYQLVRADHAELPTVVAQVLAQAQVEATALDGALFDLGPSNPQLLDPARGMSWLSEQALDMRMNPDAPVSAADIVNSWDEAALARLIWENSDERWSRRIAQRIVEARGRQAIRTGKELGEIVAGAIPRKAWPPKIHPATRVFLALRIAVNEEYRTLEAILPATFELLKPGGRLVVITFHSGEDRRVKEFMRRMTTAPEVPWPYPQAGAPLAPAEALTRKPLTASEEELRANPRSRSAKLRAIRKR